MTPKDTRFEARWLFDRLGWVILRVVPTYDGTQDFIIRATTQSGHHDTSFEWSRHPNDTHARHSIADLTPEQVHAGTRHRLNIPAFPT
jgi:hypothetical protein